MASPTSVPPTPGSSSQRQRYRYRLPKQSKKRSSSKQDSNLRTLVIVGILLVALLATLIVIALHLVPAFTGS